VEFIETAVVFAAEASMRLSKLFGTFIIFFLYVRHLRRVCAQGLLNHPVLSDDTELGPGRVH
jgi:hypothetical protein